MNKFDLYDEMKEIREEIRRTREIIVRLIIFLIFLFSGLTSGYLFLMPLSGLAIVSEKNKRKGWLDGCGNTIAGAATGATLVALFPFSLPLVVGAVGSGAVIGAVSTHLMNREVKKDIEKEFKECFNDSFIKGLLKHLGYSEQAGGWINENKKITLDADGKEIKSNKKADNDANFIKLSVIAKKRQEKEQRYLLGIVDKLLDKYLSDSEKKNINIREIEDAIHLYTQM